jgi:hypothetical protein
VACFHGLDVVVTGRWEFPVGGAWQGQKKRMGLGLLALGLGCGVPGPGFQVGLDNQVGVVNWV